jgi:hypothetical protein
MSQKEITLGITAIGVIGGLGLYLLRDSDQKKDNTSTLRQNPKSTSDRLSRLKQTNKLRLKQKTKLAKIKEEQKIKEQSFQTLKRSSNDVNKMPAPIWTTMRSIFIQGYKRGFAESENDFIERVYKDYEMQGYDRQEAISRAFDIAIKSVQDKGLIVPGTHDTTDLGSEWQKVYIRDVGQKEFNRKFSEFQMILKLSKKS